MPVTAILVEDSTTIQAALVSALQELAQVKVVGIASTEREAVALFARSAEWDIAVVDLFLREGSGLTVVRTLASRRQGQLVTVLTNYATPSIRQKCLELGADAVFDKSTQLDEFFDFIAQHFGD